MRREELVEDTSDEGLLFLDPPSLDAAIIGSSCASPGRPALVVYDYAKLLEITSKDMTEEEAEEYLQFNTVGAWVGDRTPVFVNVAKALK